MSVVLFHCSKCDSYSTSATVNVTACATLNPKRGMLCIDPDASWPEGYSIPLEDIVESRCNECDGPTELVTLDECPHWWGEHCCDGTLRVCTLCGEEQEGRVIFDE